MNRLLALRDVSAFLPEPHVTVIVSMAVVNRHDVVSFRSRTPFAPTLAVASLTQQNPG
jgi:hypothetical protein